jgi:hypothetical protein
LFLPIEGDLHVGGRYQLKGNAGGTISSCTPPQHFAATWEFGGRISWIAVKIVRSGAKAAMTLDHTAILEDHWKQFGPGAVGVGWDLTVMGLGRHLATGSAAEPAAVAAWMGSPNFKDFVNQSGEFWRVADVASGADAALAKERSDRTIAFYCGESPVATGHEGTRT